MKKMLNKREASELLRVSERTLDTMRKRGLPTRKFPGSTKCFFYEDELESWVAENSMNTQQEQTEAEK